MSLCTLVLFCFPRLRQQRCLHRRGTQRERLQEPERNDKDLTWQAACRVFSEVQHLPERPPTARWGVYDHALSRGSDPCRHRWRNSWFSTGNKIYDREVEKTGPTTAPAGSRASKDKESQQQPRGRSQPRSWRPESQPLRLLPPGKDKEFWI